MVERNGGSNSFTNRSEGGVHCLYENRRDYHMSRNEIRQRKARGNPVDKSLTNSANYLTVQTSHGGLIPNEWEQRVAFFMGLKLGW
jgi:hypothetical protein